MVYMQRLRKEERLTVRYWKRRLKPLKRPLDLPTSEETFTGDCHGKQDQEDPGRARARGGLRTQERD